MKGDRTRVWIGWLAGLLLAAGCGQDSCCGPPVVASVTVAPTAGTVVAGDTTRLTATVRDGHNQVLTDRAVTWASSNTAVATVSSTGLVTGVVADSRGVTITANSEGFSGSAVISVSPGLPILASPFVAGSFHTCALTASGAAYCWGRNSGGELGNGGSSPDSCNGFPCGVAPVAVAGGLSFSALAAGTDHTCGLTSGGVAYCWGWNGFGQLGTGSTSNATTPTKVSGTLTFSALSAGGGHTCGLTPAGAAYCWGWNYGGQLGNGGTTNSPTPVAVSGAMRFSAIAAGEAHTCGLTSAGAAYCWGQGGFGELGNGATANRPTPVAVAGSVTFSAIGGGGFNTCALTGIGTAYCWGENIAGQLGIGPTSPDECTFRPCSLTPIAVSGGLTLRALAPSGAYHKCGLTFFGTAYCWGRNALGQLGDSSTTNRTTPVATSGGLSFEVLITGGDHSCGLTSAGVAHCWGHNFGGQLGTGSTTRSVTPVPVATSLRFGP